MKEMIYKQNREIEILFEGKYKDYQFYILSLGTHPTAYVEVPSTSKLFGKGYFDIERMNINIDVHGGLTFSEDHLQRIKENTWFIGWDYAHCDDYTGDEEIYPRMFRRGGKKWTTEEIFEEVKGAIDQIIEVDNA